MQFPVYGDERFYADAGSFEDACEFAREASKLEPTKVFTAFKSLFVNREYNEYIDGLLRRAVRRQFHSYVTLVWDK